MKSLEDTGTQGNSQKSSISLPADYDYVGCYLTDYCFLKCDYCITDHNGADWVADRSIRANPMAVEAWIDFFDRLELPDNVVPTLQGGEPFLYKDIWQLIEHSPVPLDILTALPPRVKRSKFLEIGKEGLKSLNRGAPYPNVRVSYHIGQNDIEDLAQRVSELQDLISIGIFLVNHPGYPEEEERARKVCDRYGVLFKTKEFLGFHDGQLYGTYYYEDACVGKVTKPLVYCRNSVLIVAPAGDVYRCHSDLYHQRQEGLVGNVKDPNFRVLDEHTECFSYGMCSECDVKVKNNHNQEFGYTSVDIQFPEGDSSEIQPATGRQRLRVLS